MDLNQMADGAIQEIRVAGYKSICNEQAIAIRPLTILGGANSSGKSSMMQTVLLLKQTLEAGYDPGALLLNGTNVRFTSTEQMFCKMQKGGERGRFHIGIKIKDGEGITSYFKRSDEVGLEIDHMERLTKKRRFDLQIGLSSAEISSQLGAFGPDTIAKNFGKESRLVVVRDRCFLDIVLERGGESSTRIYSIAGDNVQWDVQNSIRRIIHLPALRGNPERTYPVTAVESTFPGTFEKYAASVIARWQKEKNDEALTAIGSDLRALGLTWKVRAKQIDDTQVELQVGRLVNPVKHGARDVVNIADVGFGVSQTLPIIVALHVAQPGQLVYIEQPEVHLHPKAQFQLAKIFGAAVKRGVKVVVESHSSIFILAVQTMVAEGGFDPEDVQLHWFKRDPKTGETEVTSGTLDESGAYGDWPEDFSDVMLKAEDQFLTAADAKLQN